MSTQSTATSGGIGCLPLLTIMFIGLKLSHNIDWSWIWVFSPLWLPIAAAFGIGLLVIGGAFIFGFGVPEFKRWLRAKLNRKPKPVIDRPGESFYKMVERELDEDRRR